MEKPVDEQQMTRRALLRSALNGAIATAGVCWLGVKARGSTVGIPIGWKCSETSSVGSILSGTLPSSAESLKRYDLLRAEVAIDEPYVKLSGKTTDELQRIEATVPQVSEVPVGARIKLVLSIDKNHYDTVNGTTCYLQIHDTVPLTGPILNPYDPLPPEDLFDGYSTKPLQPGYVFGFQSAILASNGQAVFYIQIKNVSLSVKNLADMRLFWVYKGTNYISSNSFELTVDP